MIKRKHTTTTSLSPRWKEECVCVCGTAIGTQRKFSDRNLTLYPPSLLGYVGAICLQLGGGKGCVHVWGAGGRIEVSHCDTQTLAVGECAKLMLRYFGWNMYTEPSRKRSHSASSLLVGRRSGKSRDKLLPKCKTDTRPDKTETHQNPSKPLPRRFVSFGVGEWECSNGRGFSGLRFRRLKFTDRGCS